MSSADFQNLIAGTIQGLEYGRLLPEIVLLAVILLVLLVDVVMPRGKSTRGVQLVSMFGLIGVIITTFLTKGNTGGAFISNATGLPMVMVDNFTVYFRIVLTFVTFLVIAVSENYIELIKARIAEYYLMLLFALFGMLLMVMGQDLLIVFLGIETMSICLYALVGMSRHKVASNEGAMKYYLLGSFTTAFMIFGIALVYGAMGMVDASIEPSTNISAIMVFFSATPTIPFIAWAGAGLIMIAFAFKAALVPFHWWSPDAYEGAPTTVTAFMSSAPKAAAFAAFIRVFYNGFGEIAIDWVPVLWWIAVLTMTFGNILALRQDSVKRMLAFSSITHAGYLVVAFISMSGTGIHQGQAGVKAILFYVLVYAIMNIGAFLVAIAINRNEDDERGYSYDDYRGLGFRKPLMAIAMLIFMISLAGIPPTAGFLGKYYIFSSAINAGFIGLAVIGVLNSAVSVYYYLRVIVNMYLKDRDEENEGRIFWSSEIAQVVFICAILILVIGLFPDSLMNAAHNAVIR